MRILIALTAVLSFSYAIAEDALQTAEFNSAWEAYTLAVESGRTERIIETSRAVVELGEKVFPETDERLALTLQKYGVALRRGRYADEAVAVLNRSLNLMEAIHGERSIELVPIIADLADANSSPGKSFRQLGYYNRAMKIVRNRHGKESTEYADIAFRAATNTFEFSRSRSGRKYLLEAHEIYGNQLGTTHLRTGMALFYLGKMQFSDRDYKNASTYLVDALPAFEGDSTEAHRYRLATRALLVRTFEFWGKSDLATEHLVAIGKESKKSPNQDYVPLFRLRPQYPIALLKRGVEGFVDIEFTVDESGFVREPRVIRSSKAKGKDGSFDAAALDAVKRFRYAPRFEDGDAVAVEGVKTRIAFKIKK